MSNIFDDIVRIGKEVCEREDAENQKDVLDRLQAKHDECLKSWQPLATHVWGMFEAMGVEVEKVVIPEYAHDKDHPAWLLHPTKHYTNPQLLVHFPGVLCPLIMVFDNTGNEVEVGYNIAEIYSYDQYLPAPKPEWRYSRNSQPTLQRHELSKAIYLTVKESKYLQERLDEWEKEKPKPRPVITDPLPTLRDFVDSLAEEEPGPALIAKAILIAGREYGNG